MLSRYTNGNKTTVGSGSNHIGVIYDNVNQHLFQQYMGLGYLVLFQDIKLAETSKENFENFQYQDYRKRNGNQVFFSKILMITTIFFNLNFFIFNFYFYF